MEQRIHCLDALRGIMMLLGIVIHSSMSYMSEPIFPWPTRDVTVNPAFDFIVIFIHAFRMPVFFVLAGFFCAMLYAKKGHRAAWANRVKRVLLPFLASLIVVLPLVKIIVLHYGRLMSWDEVVTVMKSPFFLVPSNTAHLWFLYYLLIIYAVWHLFMRWRPRVMVYLYGRLKKFLMDAYAKPAKSIGVLSVLSGFFILPQMKGSIDTSISFIPDPLIIFTYTVYFMFGYILHAMKEKLNVVFQEWKLHLLLGIGLGVAFFFLTLYARENLTPVTLVVKTVVCSVLSWLFVFGLIGLFIHKLNHESRTLSLLARASYWIYLMHLPVTIFVSGYLLNFDLPHYAKFLINVSFTFTALMLVYVVAVERSFIGAFLNGSRKRLSPGVVQG
jgi:glucans biosynthesis protein C